ncbi:MAG: bifunctional riboflavin kinase/FMN adenylyltransferase [Verrucomicrobiaceae bacterium]|nr:bifunctional riboflavin kinase/FMN adenylyltransferase [Verrucomicrobiaceae bacterium]
MKTILPMKSGAPSVFDFNGDLYGQFIEVTFVEHLRDERKFSGLDELKAQIASDSDLARRIFTGQSPAIPA